MKITLSLFITAALVPLSLFATSHTSLQILNIDAPAVACGIVKLVTNARYASGADFKLNAIVRSDTTWPWEYSFNTQYADVSGPITPNGSYLFSATARDPFGATVNTTPDQNMTVTVSNPCMPANIGNIRGYAWSDGAGWISFSSDTSGGSTFGVTESASGDLTGYAWSSTYGWIQFGGLTGFPVGNGTVSQNAKFNAAGELQGWARALTGRAAWDGWIALSGRADDGSAYGPKKSGTTIDGYAWGGEGVGWIDFYNVTTPYGLSSFSLGGSETLKISFLSSGSADSEKKTIRVFPAGGFTGDVTISVDASSLSPAPPGGTSFRYSLNNGAFTETPSSVTIPWNGSVPIQVRVSKRITIPYTFTVRGTSGGVTSTKTFTVDPRSFVTEYEEF